MIRKILCTIVVSVSLPVSGQSNIDVFEANIAELQSALEGGLTSSVELVDQYLARIEAYDKQGPTLNSIVRLNPTARDTAMALDAERVRSGARSQLHGIPILVKDNYNTTDLPTTGGSVALANFIPNANATQIDKLLEAGAIIIAKTTLHEYAYGITTIASLTGQTRNPYDYRRVPGGSSGGTGAAVAASLGAIGLGSDTCGSIRIPSAFNNLFGLRPSKGLSSIYGVMPLSHTQDVAGPLARSLDDLAILLDIVVGYDPRDVATEAMQGTFHPEFRQNLASVSLQGLRLGKLGRSFDSSNSAVLGSIEEALDWYELQGTEIIEVDIPQLDELLSASGLIGHEFRTDFDQYLSEFGSDLISDLADIVDRGLYHQAVSGPLRRSRNSDRDEAAYAEAVVARTDLRQAVEQVLRDHDLDAIVYPTVVENQVFIGDPQPGSQCQLAAHSGLPALSMPVGLNGRGLPVGMELLGEYLRDARLLSIAFPYEQAINPRRAPSVTPALENGLAPEAEILELSFTRQDIAVQARFEFDITRNIFLYELALTDNSEGEVYAVTLSMEEEAGQQLNGPIVLNLMGPDVDRSTGEYFMSPQFREAFNEGRLFLKVFADVLPVAGASQRIQ